MRSFRSRAWRWTVVVLVTGIAAGIADASSVGPVLAAIVTIGALALGYGITSAVPLYRSWRDPKRRRHWRSQAYQHRPDTAGVEFDLWSDCDHEITGLRAEVIDPDGVVHRSVAIDVAARHIEIGGAQGVGTYPDNFPSGKPLVQGGGYEIVWYGQRTSDSRWVEIARQSFTVPLPVTRLRQERV